MKSWKMSFDLSCLYFLCLLKAMAALITVLLRLQRVARCVPGSALRHGVCCKPLPINNPQLKLPGLQVGARQDKGAFICLLRMRVEGLCLSVSQV